MQRGFTLIEILVSMSIFLVVMTISLGAILGIFTANAAAQSIKVGLDNLNSSLETMSREMRFGTQWHCGAIGGDITSPQECQSDTPGTQVSFLSSDGVRIVYKLNGTELDKSIDGGVVFVPVTSNEVRITQFNIVAVGLGTTYQPKAYIYIKGQAGTKNPLNFSMQSLISQRVLNTGIFTPSQGGSASSCTGTGLLGCWLFNDGSGSSSVDSSGNGRPATLFGNFSWVADKDGAPSSAISFPGDGSTDEADISSVPSLGSTDVTISAWFKLSSSQTEATFSATNSQLGSVIFTTRTNDSDMSPTLVVTPVDGGSGNSNLGIAFSCDSGALAAGAKGSTPLVNNQWYHAVGVFTGGGGGNFAGTWDVYLNGSKDNSSSNNFYLAGTCTGSFSGNTWYIAQAPTWPGESNVTVDSVRVYNRALTGPEISAIP
jgi:prepilin-type N-terminal cleavage/methylation domain-containing protein